VTGVTTLLGITGYRPKPSDAVGCTRGFRWADGPCSSPVASTGHHLIGTRPTWATRGRFDYRCGSTRRRFTSSVSHLVVKPSPAEKPGPPRRCVENT